MLVELSCSISISILSLPIVTLLNRIHQFYWSLITLWAQFVSLNKRYVYNALINLNPNKAGRIDNIAPVVVKNCAHALTLPIHHLFTASLRSGNIPNEWKIHKIIPIYKSSDKTLVKNYHPIFLLCIILKVLERLIRNKMIDTVAAVITPCQYSFQRGSSTLH